MIKPQLVRVERYYLRFKCQYCGYEWDSNTKSSNRISCSKCKCSLRFKPGWRGPVPKPRYYSIHPETGKETEIFPSSSSSSSSSSQVSPTTATGESDIKINVKSKNKSKSKSY